MEDERSGQRDPVVPPWLHCEVAVLLPPLLRAQDRGLDRDGLDGSNRSERGGRLDLILRFSCAKAHCMNNEPHNVKKTENNPPSEVS